MQSSNSEPIKDNSDSGAVDGRERLELTDKIELPISRYTVFYCIT